MSAANKQNSTTDADKTEFRKSNSYSSTSCFSDDTELRDVPKPVAAVSKKNLKNFKATQYLELKIDEGKMENGNNGTLIRKERPRRFHQKSSQNRNKSPSVSEKTFDSNTTCTSKWSSSEEEDDEELSGYGDVSYTNSKSGSINGSVNSGSERRSRARRKTKKNVDDEEEDGSTCGDEDFHWVKTEPPSEQRTVSPSSNSNTASVSNGMPPRPPGSLDRRRQNPKNRKDRDAKSRSSHSLREKKRNEHLMHQQHQQSPGFHHSNDFLHQFGGSQFMLHEHPSMPCLVNSNGIMGCSWPSRENLMQKSAEFRSTQDLMQQTASQQQQCCNRYPFLSPAAAAMYCHCNYPFNSTSTLTLPHMMCQSVCGSQQQINKVCLKNA
ncbi:uncharacterized protein LOC134832436 [Culicoides brevitarsis]|uniref:uncharacterized protein LOC134832436 n=1 Tax=Culicoides brevitarsis TaxID=469753 RepID=UPI00307BE68C